MKTKRIVSAVIIFVMILTVAIGVHAAPVLSFSDVPDTNWAHSAIMDMVGRGMFKGMTTPVNGIGTFAPDLAMNRAQFITVLTRYLFANDLEEMPEVDSSWYANNYAVALEHELLYEEELDHGDLEKACSRQEMAMLLTRAVKIDTGETPRELVPTSRIADFDAVDPYYSDYVLQAYSMGLLTGVDDIGTFLPESALNRAQAATVIYRLLEPSTRPIVTFNEIGSFTWPDGITYEGEHINKEANGYGKMVFPEIGKYEGYFLHGKRDGIGTFTWDVGDKYVGNWKQDSMSGAGTYTFSDGYTIRGTWKDNRIEVEDFALDQSELYLEVGQKEFLLALCAPEQITDPIEWNTSDSSVVEVEGKGKLCKVTAVGYGNAKIDATTNSGKKVECSVSVAEGNVNVEKIQLNYGDYCLSVGEEMTLKTELSPYTAQGAQITWTSSDENVAYVDDGGYVTAYTAGTAIISATAENGLTASCYITVYDAKEELWHGRWTMYSSDASGNRDYMSSDYCYIDTNCMEITLEQYPYNGDIIDLYQNDYYTMTGSFETTMALFELTFTSIDEDEVILEVNEISGIKAHGDHIQTSYYVLKR